MVLFLTASIIRDTDKWPLFWIQATKRQPIPIRIRLLVYLFCYLLYYSFLYRYGTVGLFCDDVGNFKLEIYHLPFLTALLNELNWKWTVLFIRNKQMPSKILFINRIMLCFSSLSSLCSEEKSWKSSILVERAKSSWMLDFVELNIWDIIFWMEL